MAVTSPSEETFVYFTTKEDKLIKDWLEKQDYTYSHNTTCGGCCGMYEDEYWVNGIGGEFPAEKQKEFLEYAKENEIGCKIYGYTIQAFDGEPFIKEW